MLDIRFIRSSPEKIKADLTKRGDTEKIGWVDDLLSKDVRARELKIETDALRQRRNTIAREINAARKGRAGRRQRSWPRPHSFPAGSAITRPNRNG